MKTGRRMSLYLGIRHHKGRHHLRQSKASDDSTLGDSHDRLDCWTGPIPSPTFDEPKSNVYRFLIRPIENCGSTAILMILLCLGAQVIYFVPSFTKSSKAAGKSHTHPKRIAAPSVSAGLAIYSDQDDLSYGQGIASTRSNASSSATLLHFKDVDPSNADRTRQNPRITRYGSTSSVSPVTSDASDDDDDEPATKDQDDISNYRVWWIAPVPIILFARMLLVPMICLPFIIFHPIHMSPVLTTDPMFTLAWFSQWLPRPTSI
jgi:hypothetical protein